MNYTPPATGGGGGITQLHYTEIDLTGQDFTKLNTSPLQVLDNQGQTIIPVSVTVSYNCTNGLAGFPILIGFESLLVNYLTGAWYSAPVSGDRNIFTSQYDFTAGGATFSNLESTRPLVLWCANDDNTLTFAEFKVNILYLLVNNI